MRVGTIELRTIWPVAEGVAVIDQTRLPHGFEVATLKTLDDAVAAIRDMIVRGAPLIGVTAAYGLVLAAREDASDAAMEAGARRLVAARPTAVNLVWAVET